MRIKALIFAILYLSLFGCNKNSSVSIISKDSIIEDKELIDETLLMIINNYYLNHEYSIDNILCINIQLSIDSNKDTIFEMSRFNCRDSALNYEFLCINDSLAVAIYDPLNLGINCYDSSKLVRLNKQIYQCDTSRIKGILIYQLAKTKFYGNNGIHEQLY